MNDENGATPRVVKYQELVESRYRRRLQGQASPVQGQDSRRKLYVIVFIGFLLGQGANQIGEILLRTVIHPWYYYCYGQPRNPSLESPARRQMTRILL